MQSLAGKFLVAKPVLRDPSFNQSVVLILQHGAEGAFGLVVNRPAAVKGLPFPLFTGGPCEFQGMLMLHGHVEWMQDSPQQPVKGVAPGIFLGDASCLERISAMPSKAEYSFRMFTGYAGWGPDQLERELAAGAWAVVPATGSLLFHTPVQELWERLLPPAIPEPSLN